MTSQNPESKLTSGKDSNSTDPHEEAMLRLTELIADVKVTMMSTIGLDEILHSRPMMTQAVGEDGILWFFTGDFHGKADELAADPRINLSYAVPEKSRFVSVSGLAEVVHDEAKKKELWQPLYKAWFPDGPEDPRCSLIRVLPEKAEYWDSPSSTLLEIAGFAKAILTGKRYAAEGSHDQLDLTATRL